MFVRRNLLYICVLPTAITATASQDILAAEAEKPNILFIFTDDQPQICVGCMGNGLASEGVLFTAPSKSNQGKDAPAYWRAKLSSSAARFCM
jgi:hypothetical protein